MKRIRLSDLNCIIAGGTDGNGGGDGPVVVLLHGFGAPGDDLAALAPVLAVPQGTRFVFPAAPYQLGPEYMGGRAWWHIDLAARILRRQRGDFGIDEVPEGLVAARTRVMGVIDEVALELRPPPGQIVLGGFSQGAMLSLDVALHTQAKLAGLVFMSGTHIAGSEWAPRFSARQGLPVFMSHGTEDDLLPITVSEQLRDTLLSHGMEVDWIPFRGGHGIPENVVGGVGAFITRVLA